MLTTTQPFLLGLFLKKRIIIKAMTANNSPAYNWNSKLSKFILPIIFQDNLRIGEIYPSVFDGLNAKKYLNIPFFSPKSAHDINIKFNVKHYYCIKKNIILKITKEKPIYNSSNFLKLEKKLSLCIGLILEKINENRIPQINTMINLAIKKTVFSWNEYFVSALPNQKVHNRKIKTSEKIKQPVFVRLLPLVFSMYHWFIKMLYW